MSARLDTVMRVTSARAVAADTMTRAVRTATSRRTMAPSGDEVRELYRREAGYLQAESDEPENERHKRAHEPHEMTIDLLVHPLEALIYPLEALIDPIKALVDPIEAAIHLGMLVFHFGAQLVGLVLHLL